MRLSIQLVEGIFLSRLNRFTVLADVSGTRSLVHLANSGRLHEVLVPGARIYLRPAARPGRKTGYDLALVRLGERLVSMDARLPGPLVHEAMLAGRLSGLESYCRIRQEVCYGAHRLDLLAENGDGQCLIETKSITLVVNGCALFPDSPTLRGAQHMETLLRFRQEGGQAAVIFVVQRDDAEAFSPNDQTDPVFGSALREAARGGVMVRAFLCRVSLAEVCLDREIPVQLDL